VPWCPPFVELVHSTVAILRVAIEPLKSSDIAALARGLQILNQADAHVEILGMEEEEKKLFLLMYLRVTSFFTGVSIQYIFCLQIIL
jgi:hypothetical protein